MSEQIQPTAAPRKKRILSCIQPTGIPTLGNYLGALKNWVLLADEFDSAYAVADLHAITVRQEPAAFRKQILEAFALLIALGLDPEKIFFSFKAKFRHMHSLPGFSTATPSSASFRA